MLLSVIIEYLSKEDIKILYDKIHQFIFDDVEDESNPEAITDLQAEEIAAILVTAYGKGSNIICHCHAGICRSGAVVEVGLMLGFNDNDKTAHFWQGHNWEFERQEMSAPPPEVEIIRQY